jgi:hypothetical protein
MLVAGAPLNPGTLSEDAFPILLNVLSKKSFVLRVVTIIQCKWFDSDIVVSTNQKHEM